MANLRERNRLEKRDALVSAAWGLFEVKGFEATTADEIAATAGVSRRTFFRYFPSKEAVAFPDAEARLVAFRTLLAETEGTPAARVRQACLAMAAHFAEVKDELLAQHRLVARTPALLAYDLELDRGWEAEMTRVLADGARSAAAQRRAAVWAAAIMGAVRATLRAWYAQDARPDLVRLGREALDHLEMGMAAAMPAVTRRRGGVR